MNYKVGIVSLGCAKNQVDAEMLLYTLKNRGFIIVNDPADADAVIVNTCGFIESAKQESINEIIELGKLKDEGKIKAIIVTGCLAQRYKSEISEQLLFSKHNAPRGAVRQLVQKGIDRELAEEIIEGIDFDPCDGIRAVIDRKYKNINDEKIRRRAVAALQRLGYGWDDIKTVLREYTEED